MINFPFLPLLLLTRPDSLNLISDINLSLNEPFWKTSFPTWVQAVGTLLVFGLALYSPSIKRRIYKPKLEVTYTGLKPCLDEQIVDQKSSASSPYTVPLFRLKVINKGNDIAYGCHAVTDKLYIKNADESK